MKNTFNLIKSIQNLTRLEKGIWIGSLIVIAVSYLFLPDKDLLTLLASLVGATALIFVGKGDPIGQLITIIFAVFYGIISFRFRYYGEMITYMCMTAPTAFVAMYSWLKNPYSEREVKVGNMTGRKWILLILSTILVTAGMGVVLWLFDTNNLIFSTISVTTSFLASMLTVFRSPYYAVAYAANDVVLIILWVLATIVEPQYFPMIICFVIFLVNDTYGFINWRRMMKKQI